jgi:hypothetical protein
MEHTDAPLYPNEGKQLTREEVRVIVAEAHVWQEAEMELVLAASEISMANTRRSDWQSPSPI